MFLLDTNVVSELRKGERADGGVLEWLDLIDDAHLFLSVLVVGELRQGVERLRIRNPAHAERLDRWVHILVDSYAARILPVDTRVAELWGRLNLPDPLSTVDGLLAATAIAHDLTFVTRNVKDVARTGVRVHDPFGS